MGTIATASNGGRSGGGVAGCTTRVYHRVIVTSSTVTDLCPYRRREARVRAHESSERSSRTSGRSNAWPTFALALAAVVTGCSGERVADAGGDTSGDSTVTDVAGVDAIDSSMMTDNPTADDSPVIDAPTDATDVASGEPPPSATPTQVAVGWSHSCAVLSNRTVACWGRNMEGQLGDGTTTMRLDPVIVRGLTNALQVAAGENHTCARLADGTVRCWGWNERGQLGDGSATSRTTPTPVMGLSGVVEIALGYRHSCARLADGTARCWGYNGQGGLGDPDSADQRVPVVVVGLSGATQLAASHAHTCARLNDGTVQCWGANTSGQIGNGRTLDTPNPTTVMGLTNVTSVTAGSGHTCVRMSDGTARCWGANFRGQLGRGTAGSPILAPGAVPGLTGVAAMRAGYEHTCALLMDGTARCFGLNDYGQLGDGTTTNQSSPAAVVRLSGAAELSICSHHACVRLGDDTVHCWGLNGSAQLGDGRTFDRSSPGPAVMFP